MLLIPATSLLDNKIFFFPKSQFELYQAHVLPPKWLSESFQSTVHRLIYNIQSIYYLEIDIALQFHKRRLNRHGNDANELRYRHDYFAFHPRISLVSRAAGQTFSCREIAAPLSEMEAGQMWSSVIVCSTCHGKKKKNTIEGREVAVVWYLLATPLLESVWSILILMSNKIPSEHFFENLSRVNAAPTLSGTKVNCPLQTSVQLASSDPEAQLVLLGRVRPGRSDPIIEAPIPSFLFFPFNIDSLSLTCSCRGNQKWRTWPLCRFRFLFMTDPTAKKCNEKIEEKCKKLGQQCEDEDGFVGCNSKELPTPIFVS